MCWLCHRTHLIGAVAYLIYFAIRPFLMKEVPKSTPNQMMALLPLMNAILFFSSCTYHVYSPHPILSAPARLLDYTAIYLNMSFSMLVVSQHDTISTHISEMDRTLVPHTSLKWTGHYRMQRRVS